MSTHQINTQKTTEHFCTLKSIIVGDDFVHSYEVFDNCASYCEYFETNRLLIIYINNMYKNR